MSEDKTLDVVDVEDAKEKVSDISIVGNGDLFRLMSKASSKSEGWMKSTKVLPIPGVGCVLQVTTQQGENVAEALTFIPGVVVAVDTQGNPILIKD